MRKFTLYFCCALSFLTLTAGCQEQESSPRKASLKGIKISDLAPPDAQRLPQQVQFDIVTFEIPAESYDVIEKSFTAMSDIGISYRNRKMFTANGFHAAKGTQDMWSDLARALRMSRARRALTNKVTIFDTQGDFININIVNQPIEAFYIDEENHDASIVLGPGKIALKIRTRVPEQFTGYAKFDITAMHKKHGSALPQLNKNKDDDETLFDYTNIRLDLTEGDFLLFGCSEYSHKRLEVKNLFFNFIGDYPMPVEETEAVINDLGYKIVKNVPLVRLYMLVGIRVSN